MRQVKQVYLRGIEIQYATVMLPNIQTSLETFLNCQQRLVAQVKLWRISSFNTGCKLSGIIKHPDEIVFKTKQNFKIKRNITFIDAHGNDCTLWGRNVW